MNHVKLISPMYKCQGIPVIVFSKRCPAPCLYCGLQKYNFDEKLIIAQGVEDVIKKASAFKGVYLSPITDCFFPENSDLTHYILEKTWELNLNWTPLIITKQIIPDKTIDLFSKNTDRLVLQISVPTLDEEIAKILEPGSFPIHQRLEMIQNLIKFGINVICVVMPYFGFDNPKVFAQKLSEIGVKRVITATGVLVDETRKRMLNSCNGKIRKIAESISFLRGQKYIFPKEERVRILTDLVSALKDFEIKSKICTSDNHDLEDTNLTLCHQFNHKNFR